MRVVGFRVRDVDRTRRVLGEREASFCTDVREEVDHQERPYRSFDIATPLGDVRFRFVERASDALAPGFAPLQGYDASNRNRLQVIDHITSNMLTISRMIPCNRSSFRFVDWRPIISPYR